MNMILHGIEAPNIIHTNTLSENLTDVEEKHRYDVIMANPSFGGKERAEVQRGLTIVVDLFRTQLVCFVDASDV